MRNGQDNVTVFVELLLSLHPITQSSINSIHKMKKLLTLLLVALTSIQMSAQIRGNNIVVTVQPDHQDWTYKTGEKAQFVVNVLKSGTLLDNVSIDYAAGPEMYQDVKKSAVLKDGTLKLTGTMKQPGFYRVDVTAHVGGKDYKGAPKEGAEAEWMASVIGMLDYMRRSRIWAENIVQIHVDKGGDLILVPRDGNERFIFGEPHGVAGKFSRIEDYYRYIRPSKDEDWYRTVNVKYDNQIICKR